MRVIIAGSRSIIDPQLVAAAVESSGFDITNVISGGAHGVDRLGEDWARAHGVSLTVFSADWKMHGKAAGPIRNEEMARHADALIAVRQGGESSRGTTHMIETARKKGIPVYVHEVSVGAAE